MNTWTKIFILLIINMTISLGIIYLLDYMQVINYNMMFQQIFRVNIRGQEKIEDPFLLEKEELNKKWELLAIKEKDILKQSAQIEKKHLALETENTKIQNEREAFLNEQNLAKIKKEEEASYNIKIRDVALQISGMPPNKAAELLNLQDDLQVVDIFKTMNELSEENGIASTVPFLLTLIEREKAARIQTLMLTAINS